VSALELAVARVSLSGWLEYCKIHSLTLAQGLSVLGYGYKAKGNLMARLRSLPSRLRGYIVAFHSPSGPESLSLREWLMMRTIGSSYKSDDRIGYLVDQFLSKEVKRVLDRLDALAPLLQKAKELGTVKRDREHYGTVERGLDRLEFGHDLSFRAIEERYLLHLGVKVKPEYLDRVTSTDLWMEYPGILDDVIETVFREPNLDTVIAARGLRSTLEELEGVDFTWAELEKIWFDLDNIESAIASLSLPRELSQRAVKGRMSLGNNLGLLARWHTYSAVFLKTSTPKRVAKLDEDNKV
jgi:hypothetical protein